ncbi:FxLYD domain-containing protein [Halococcus agarilyticus]|uniref:FxLYD domain-containing protein n=1 Tax=Halococcus agarilyticus TaxID=1232219 RepID=UPI002B4B1796|nr:FxLYD domain-containing protein [Halococcus agarilyticus]
MQPDSNSYQTRRRYLAQATTTLAAGSTVVLAGCSESDAGSNEGSGTVGNSDASGNDDTERSDVVAEDSGVVVLSSESYTSDFSGGVTGLVENRSENEASYVQVEIGFYRDDTKVGDGLDNTNNLPSGAQWEYDAAYLEADGWDSVTEYTVAITAR